jgi:hypothetical protein
VITGVGERAGNASNKFSVEFLNLSYNCALIVRYRKEEKLEIQIVRVIFDNFSVF